MLALHSLSVMKHDNLHLQGFETAKKATLQFLETFRDKVQAPDSEVLLCVARPSLRTKLYQELADQLTDIVVDAVLTIRKEDEPLDLYMVHQALPQCLSDCPTSHIAFACVHRAFISDHVLFSVDVTV